MNEVTSSCVGVRDHSILLISSHNDQNKWVLPKGGWEIDESEEEAALREAFEEAGVSSVRSFNCRLQESWARAFLSTPMRTSIITLPGGIFMY